MSDQQISISEWNLSGWFFSCRQRPVTNIGSEPYSSTKSSQSWQQFVLSCLLTNNCYTLLHLVATWAPQTCISFCSLNAVSSIIPHLSPLPGHSHPGNTTNTSLNTHVYPERRKCRYCISVKFTWLKSVSHFLCPHIHTHVQVYCCTWDHVTVCVSQWNVEIA